jgi:hypothetical protein
LLQILGIQDWGLGNISCDAHIPIKKDEDLQTFIYTMMFICKEGEDGLGWHLLGMEIEQNHLEIKDQRGFR